MAKVADRIKELRIEKNLTQLELSKATGVSQNAIAQWENGKRTPNINAIIVLAKYFGVTTDYLLCVVD
ncbi:MAG: helix-turn-helix transcriptional regulator [Clostridiales bacterium]|nr:helix-turn-helix transcriptional regulator [Clostridiales bacterium]